jgi:CBS domain-containing protein
VTAKLRQARDLWAFLGTVVFIAMGVGVIWFVKDQVGIKGDAVLISVLLLPALLYLAISGRLTEITGPGGIGAKFRAAATTRVRGEIQPTKELQQVPKGGLHDLEKLKPQLSDERPLVLTFKLDQTSDFGLGAIKSYLSVLKSTRGFGVVVFVDANDKVLGYVTAERFSALMDSDAATNIVERLNDQSAHDRLADLPGIVTTTIPVGANNSEALGTMTEHRLDVAVIVDRDQRLSGVIDREQLIATMLLAATA